MSQNQINNGACAAESKKTWRRLRIFRFSPSLLLIFREWQKFEVTKNGLPMDANIVRTFTDYEHDEFCVVLESETFSQVEPGQLIPEAENVQIRLINESLGTTNV